MKVIRTIRKVGSGQGSHFLVIPLDIIKHLKWAEKDDVAMEIDGNKLIITKDTTEDN
jgi:antitoxin component of MazEF toxin-antitoxin module